MLINNLNLNLLRVFESVYRQQSMTKAAEELFMTQSGVSQNIKNLEELLGVRLFDRVKQRPLPTSQAQELYEFCGGLFVELEDALLRVTNREREFRGVIRVGLPIEFGNNVVLPMISKWLKQHPELHFRFRYDLAPRIQDDLLKGELDFAIVDEFSFDSAVETRPIASEILVLCASAGLLTGNNNTIESLANKKLGRKFFESLSYVDYIEDAPILQSWFHHHYQFTQFRPSLRGVLMDVQGMAKMVTEDFGAGVLPLHVAKKLKELGHELHVFEGRGEPLINRLSLIKLKKRTFSPEVIGTLSFLEQELGKREIKQQQSYGAPSIA
jgi:DNA-binding transcriptional LysR family regulator